MPPDMDPGAPSVEKAEILVKESDQMIEAVASRKGIVIRLLYTILFLIVLEIVKLCVQVAVVFQYIYLLITRRHNTPVRIFSNQLAAYAYRVLRYVTLNENERPFPFSAFPGGMEPPAGDDPF
jgi:hypothetical protein